MGRKRRGEERERKSGEGERTDLLGRAFVVHFVREERERERESNGRWGKGRRKKK